MELRRFRMVMTGIDTATVRAKGLGAIEPERLHKQIDQVAQAYGLPNPPTIERIFNPKFLPPQSERMLPGN